MIKNKLGGIVVISAFLFSCCNHQPKEVLGEKEMVNLMADLQLAESYSNNIVSHQSAEDRNKIGQGVLKAHGVSQEELDSTLAWYGRNLDEYAKLYEKVDKEIADRRKEMMNERISDNDLDNDEMLWPYKSHGIISPLGNSDAWILSVESPELEKGDLLEWTIRFLEYAQMSGVLGVEYSDGSSDANSMTLSGRQKYEIRLQTDTGKTVKRIYGSIRLKDTSSKPMSADSIMLRRLPYDSLEYNKYRSQRHYGIPVKIKKQKSDTVSKDTVSNNLFRNKDLELARSRVSDSTAMSGKGNTPRPGTNVKPSSL